MQCVHLQRRLQTGRRGSALLGLLIVIALAGLVYFGQWWLKRTAKDPDLCHDLMPWQEWRLRESIEEPPPEPSEVQPKLTETIKFDVSAKAKDVKSTPRGQISLVINPNGTVRGGWGGNYYNDDKVNFDGDGGFEGYVCPLKIYRDENGEDPTKLYFIAKGEFMLHKSDLKKTYRIIAGDLYVTGWLNDDLSAGGKITITSDEKYFETFEWKGPPLL